MLLFSVVFVDFAVVELKAPYTCTFADEAKIETRTACFVPGVSQKVSRPVSKCVYRHCELFSTLK